MLNIKDIGDDLLWAKCPYCGYNYLPKLKVFFGTENNKNNRLVLTTSIVDSVILYSPKTLNYNMFDNAKNNYNINIEEFKSNYNPFFWNIIWYFKVKKLPFDFILPYEDNIFYYLINNKQKSNDYKEKHNNSMMNSKNFKVKFCQYVKKQKEDLKNKRKNWNKNNELIICFDEIDIFIPPKNTQGYIIRNNSNISHVSDFPSVINVNDFENASQFSLEKSSHGSIIDAMNRNYNLRRINEIKTKNNFNSSISIIKLKPQKKQNYLDSLNKTGTKNNSSKGIEFLTSSVKKNHYGNSSTSLKFVQNKGVIKILRDNKIEKKNLMDKYMENSPKKPTMINYFIDSS